MRFVNNDPEQIEIRKSQNTLIVVGTGTALFGIWTMIKMLGLIFLLRDETFAALLSKTGPLEGLSENAVFWFIIIIVLALMALFTSARVYVGLSAISEGRGKRHGKLYIVLAVFMIIGGVWTFCTGLSTMEAPEQMGAFTRNQSISTIIIEATSIIMLIQMVISSLKIKRLTGNEASGKD